MDQTDDQKVLEEQNLLPIEDLQPIPPRSAPIGRISEVFLSDDEENNLIFTRMMMMSQK